MARRVERCAETERAECWSYWGATWCLACDGLGLAPGWSECSECQGAGAVCCPSSGQPLYGLYVLPSVVTSACMQDEPTR